MAVYSEGRKIRPHSGSRWAAGAAIAAGAGLLAFALLRPAPAGIPGWEPANAALRVTMERTGAATAASPSPAGAPSPAASSATEPAASARQPAAGTSALLDLNAATAVELDGLPGIGAAKAEAIVAYRTVHGGFRSVDDLLEVKGIGPKLLAQIRPLVAVGSGKPVASPVAAP